MFGRKKDEEERTELDAAWDDENTTPPSVVDDDGEDSDASFPEPNAFDMTSDTVPLNDAEREEAGDAPFDTDDSFAYDAESEEFTEGDAVGFLDDSHTDFYEYGQEKHGVHDELEAPEEEGIPESVAVAGSTAVGKHGSGLTTKQAQLEAMPEHQKRSRRMRRTLIVVFVLLLALLAALAYFGWHLYQESRAVAEAETSDVTTEVEIAAEVEEVAPDTGSASTKNTNVTQLLGLLGKKQDDALKALGSGAAVTMDAEIADETSPMMRRLTVVLTEEPTDTKSGSPTVYLGVAPDDTVVIAGYSAATASLGYGTLSFADVVSNEHVIERTLTEAGLNVADGTVNLPDSKTYSSYAADGSTLVKEQCSFDGSVSQGGKDYSWTSVLVYNYTAANATGNLADTVRQVYVYVSDKAAAEKALEEKTKILKEREEAKAREEAEKKAAEEAAKREEEERRAAEEAAAAEAAEQPAENNTA